MPANITSDLDKLVDKVGYNMTMILYQFNHYMDVEKTSLQNISSYINNSSPIGVTVSHPASYAIPLLLIMYVIYSIFLALSAIQVIAILHSGLYLFKDPRKSGIHYPPRTRPFVSIIIPVKNEAMDVIEKVLKNVASLSYPRDKFEAIVVSDDDEEAFSSIEAITMKYSKLYGVRMTAINRKSPIGYKGGAINYAIQFSKGELIMVLDADTEVPPNYLMYAVSYMEAGYDMVGAVYRGRPAIPTTTSKAIKVVYDIFNEIIILGRFLSRQKWGFSMIMGTNFVIRRETLMRVGGICHCTADDMDLSLKVKMSGGRVAVMREVTAISEVTSTYMALKAQNIRWSSNDSIILRRYFRRIIKSDMPIIDKIDILLWLTKYPLLSLGGLSIFISIILSIFGVILPPFYVLALEGINIILLLGFLTLMLAIARKMNYGIMTMIFSLTTMSIMGFSISFAIIYHYIEAMFKDLEWIYTPKGSKAAMRVNGLLMEKALTVIFIMTSIILFILGYYMAFIYSTIGAIIMILTMRRAK